MIKVKVLVPWLGTLPVWTPQFMERVSHSYPTFEWQIFPLSWPFLRERIQQTTGVLPPERIAPRKLCDYRPAFGEIFAQEIGDTPWWGWSDLDCVFGNIGRFIQDVELRHYDLITDHESIVNGPFTIMRNSPQMRTLYRKSQMWEWVFASDEHVAFDEKGFTDVVRASRQVSAFYLGAHTHDRIAPTPTFQGEQMRVDGTEYMTYHFARGKWWPL